MAITVGSLILPDGLHWSDEYQWSPIAQNIEFGLTGAQIIDLGEKQDGRPITLRGVKDGNSHSALIARDQTYRSWSSVEALRAALWAVAAEFTLTLHDGRAFNVVPLHDGDGPLIVTPLSVFRSFAPPNPGAAHLYFLDSIRFVTKAVA